MENEQEEDIRCVRITITGLVQQVGYREFAQRVASMYGISGCAQNLPDGRVEVRATGTPSQLRELIRQLKRGPERSKVEDLHIRWESSATVPNDGSFVTG